MKDMHGRAIRCGDIVINHRAGAGNPDRSGVVFKRGSRIGKLNPGEYIELADLEGGAWELSGLVHEPHLEIVGFLDLSYAKEGRE